MKIRNAKPINFKFTMSSTLSQYQAPRKRPNFELEADDNYVGLCGEIYITQKRYVVFHCCLCKENYYELKKYLRHVSQHYANYGQWKDSTAKAALDTENTKTPNASEEDPLIEGATEDVEYLIEEEMEDDSVKVLAETAHEIEETAELAANAVDESRGAEIKDIKFEDVIIVGRDEAKRHSTEKLTTYTDFVVHDKGHSIHSKRAAVMSNRTLRNSPKRPHANASTRGRNQYRYIRVHTRSNFENTAADESAKKVPIDVEYERKFKCYICGFVFNKSYNLRAHLVRHTDQKRYSCTMCPKQFYTRPELTKHQRRHTGERPFTCEQCGLGFFTGSQLSQHKRRHSNLRPHKCTQCDKRFYDLHLLREHFVKHTQERNFICKTCNASFTRKKALLVHMKLHANLKEYVCSTCQQGFNQRSGLKAHIKSKHKVEA